MTTCDLNQNYRVGFSQAGVFKYERDICLSENRKKLILKKFQTATPDKSGSFTDECERIIENTRLGIRVTPAFNLLFEAPNAVENCSMITQFEVTNDKYPKIEILMEKSLDGIERLQLIGIEDIRIGKEALISFPIENGFNISYETINNRQFIVLEVWKKQ